MPITETARSIRAAANRWFYELEFSPTVDATVADRVECSPKSDARVMKVYRPRRPKETFDDEETKTT